jgi:hypothetical protein
MHTLFRQLQVAENHSGLAKSTADAEESTPFASPEHPLGMASVRNQQSIHW